jgi:glycosyltransferase involved in cell wall biosynthesis
VNHPLISVIIPTYNRQGFLLQAVESVFKQTVADYELIVIDDGSTDGTGEGLKPYENRLQYIYRENRGVSAARNTGLQAARGDWIAFLDSDDYWLPAKLETQVRFFAENPQALICQTEEIWIRHGRRVNPHKKHRKFSGDIFSPSLIRCIVSPSAVMIRREFLNQIGPFDESLPACEDYDLWLRISCRFPVFLIEEPLVVKQGGHPDQLSRRIPFLDRFRIQALVKVLGSDLLSSDRQETALQELKKKCRIYGQGCMKRGKKEEGAYYLGLPEAMASRLQSERPVSPSGTFQAK